jgi:hypothetical protein
VTHVPAHEVDQFLRENCGLSLLSAREDMEFPAPSETHIFDGDMFCLLAYQRWLDAWLIMHRAWNFASHCARHS